MSCGSLGMSTQNFMEVTFSSAGSGKLSCGRCFDGLCTFHDQMKMPQPRHSLPVNWGL